MTSRPRVSFIMRRAVIVTTLAATLAAPAAGAAQAPSARVATPAAGGADAQAAAMDDFQKRLQAYLDLREALAKKVKPLSPTPDSAELTARQESLAVAMKSARATAKPARAEQPKTNEPRSAEDHASKGTAATSGHNDKGTVEDP